MHDNKTSDLRLINFMTRLFSSERTKWLFAIGLVAITGGYSYKVLSHSFGHPCNSQRLAHSYDPHHCKASEEIGCKG